MTRTLALLLLSSAVGCAVDDASTTTGTATSDITINPAKDATEPAYYQDHLCKMVFPGGLTPSTETYAIWNIGTNGIVNAPYNTPQRHNLYAVFGTTAKPFEIHHVDGFDQYDHYHVLQPDSTHHHGPGCGHAGHEDDVQVQNDTWDLLVYTPGPNFDLATYHSATSEAEVFAQSAAGILGPLSTPAIFGLPGLVLYAPIDCSYDDDHGHGGGHGHH